jgi:hypothetical protein
MLRPLSLVANANETKFRTFAESNGDAFLHLINVGATLVIARLCPAESKTSFWISHSERSEESGNHTLTICID